MVLREPLHACRRLVTKLKSLGSSSVPKPPYEFITQVGDPVLRKRAEPVDPEQIRTPDIQEVLSNMKHVMRRTLSIGISAPQVGSSYRIMMVEFPHAYLKHLSRELIQSREYMVFPLKVFINPTLQVINSWKIWFPEGCESIRGYSADVPRHYEVKISGLNEKAEPHEWQVRGWPARIIQHEVDHLDGILYIDHMDSRTYQFHYWQAIRRLPS
ncbi:peptide deformylase, mitochondrial-like [Ornithodoros turicata]|uniref:peptide deformylase, mitochondrial-like n=1 Tax=Ornithodoros turicata TaxID=34597 RepID=UPI0031389E88